jgi:hypothetical protein
MLKLCRDERRDERAIEAEMQKPDNTWFSMGLDSIVSLDIMRAERL